MGAPGNGQPVTCVRASGLEGERGVERVIGLHPESVGTQARDALAGVVLAVLRRLGEAVHARQSGDGRELLAGKRPFGQGRGGRGRGGGDKAVLRMNGEMELIGQKADPFCGVSGVPPKTWAWRGVPGGR